MDWIKQNMKNLKIKAAFILLVLILGTTGILVGQYSGEGRKIIYDKNSVYYRIVVFDKDNLRYLVFGNNVHQTVMDKSNPDRIVFEYAKTLISSIYLQNNRSHALLVGLGGGALVKFFKRYLPNTKTDVSEIDPMVIDVAKKYFQTEFNHNIKAYAYDGRIFIRRVQKKYDIVMLDAYNSDYIPFHLMTKEFFTEIKNKMTPNGVVYQNIWTSNKLMVRLLNTLKSLFKYVYVAPGVKTSNAIIYASDAKPDFSQQSINRAFTEFKKNKLNYEFGFVESLRRYKEHTGRFQPSLVLTDEHAPLNYFHGAR